MSSFTAYQENDLEQLRPGTHGDEFSYDAAARPTSRRNRAFAIAAACVLALVVYTNMGASSTATTATGAATAASTPLALAVDDNTKLGQAFCDDPDFTKKSLKLVHEMAIIGLFNDTQGESNFEASDIKLVEDELYVVSDDVWSIGRLEQTLQFNSHKNVLVPDAHPRPQGPEKIMVNGKEVDAPHKENGYEGLFYDHLLNRFFGMVETDPDEKGNLRAIVDEIQMDRKTNTFERVRSCRSDFTFDDSNLGFEGVMHIRHNDNFYLFGLCESNHCAAGAKGEEKGNGKLVMMTYFEDKKEGTCGWKTEKILNIPKSADFKDYSAIAYQKNTHRVAITSQESSQVWIGAFDLDKMELTEGEAFVFPRDDSCHVVYCNIEGIDWMTEHILVAASDKMKSKGRQNYRCQQKDQSVHVFALPR